MNLKTTVWNESLDQACGACGVTFLRIQKQNINSHLLFDFWKMCSSGLILYCHVRALIKSVLRF